MNKVFITDYVSDPYIEHKILGKELSNKPSKDIEVLLVWHQTIDKQYLDQFPKLKGVIRYGVGFDNIDIQEIESRGILFCNTPDYGTDEVSDTALAMMLGFLRGIFAYDIFSKNYFDSWQENTIPDLRRLSELTLGVLGAGRIGTALMRKTKALGMNIVFYDPYKDSGYEKAIGVNRFYNREEFLSNCDIVSIHTPLTNETKFMVDENFVSSMKKGSILINTSRGEVIQDLDVLYKALKEGQLSAVGLDVLPSEPPKKCSLINAWRCGDKNLAHKVIINPHTSYYSQDSYIEMRTLAAKNAWRILKNIKPINIITSQK